METEIFTVDGEPQVVNIGGEPQMVDMGGVPQVVNIQSESESSAYETDGEDNVIPNWDFLTCLDASAANRKAQVGGFPLKLEYEMYNSLVGAIFTCHLTTAIIQDSAIYG